MPAYCSTSRRDLRAATNTVPYREGQAAFDAEQSISENPYRWETDASTQWRSGFYQAYLDSVDRGRGR